MSVGGSIIEVALSGRGFAVASDADSNRSLGGSMNELDPNGNRTARLIKNYKPWKTDNLVLDIDDQLDAQEYIQAEANKTDYITVIITYASGIRYSGRAQITGEIQVSSQKTTATITLEGPETLEQQ